MRGLTAVALLHTDITLFDSKCILFNVKSALIFMWQVESFNIIHFVNIRLIVIKIPYQPPISILLYIAKIQNSNCRF